MERTMAQARYA